MAQSLQSPGVSVSVIDQSFYTPAAPGTVPLIFVATAENKQNASSTGIAQGTTKANAGTVWIITSQRDLVDTFGTPYFQTISGTPVNGGEINEYGLQAAYSVLGASSQAYVVRADVDLGQLVGTSNSPQGTPTPGTVWIDTSDSMFGINVWNTASNFGAGGFTQVTPLIIDDTNYDTSFSAGLPIAGFGTPGQFAMVIPSQMSVPLTPGTGLYYKSKTLGWTQVTNNFDSNKSLQISPNYQYPHFDSNTATGSVWVCTTPISTGATWDVKYFSGTHNAWSSVNAPLYPGKQAAIQALDSVNGGLSIPQGTVFIDTDVNNVGHADFEVFIRSTTGPTVISLTSASTTNPGGTYSLRETTNTGTWANSTTVHVSAGGYLGQNIAAAINTSTGLVNVSATFNTLTSLLTITHALGGDIQFADGTSTPLANIGLISGVGTIANLTSAATGDGGYTAEASNWTPASYFSQPTTDGIAATADGTLWFNNFLGDADILYNNGTAWVGYRTVDFGAGVGATDPNGPIISSTAPTTQSTGAALKTGDIWINSSNPDTYGQVIYIYNSHAGTGTYGWVLQDTSDHTSPNGWVFADARWSDNGHDGPSYITPISDLLSSSYLDPDAPSARLYPRGTRLFNTRRSSNNVKVCMTGYINPNQKNANASNESQAAYSLDRWVTASANNSKGQGTFGRLSQRAVVVASMAELIGASTSVRDTDTLNYNLIAAPGYTELIPDMVNLNTDIGQLALVVGDTPFRLASNATTLHNWGSNASKATGDGDDGLVTSDDYTAVYYPSGYTHDNLGNKIVVPASHMMLHTIINSDNVSYPWFAPAGTNRGVVTNASSVGYIDPITGEFTTSSLYEGLRNVLSGVKVNPIATLPGAGLVTMGQYTRDANSTALNRINVARLVSYLRRQLSVLSKPYLFEPNDSQTRNEIKTSIENLMLELVAQRALYDFVVVCDKTNNTPTRIDRNELWVDIAIEPVKSVEFIYIPLRLLNTGAIASGNFGSQAKGSSNSSTGQ